MTLFFEIIEKAYRGIPYTYEKKTYRLSCTLVQPADFYKRTFGSDLTSYDTLLRDLDFTFKSVARSEVYRKKTGWIAQGLLGYSEHQIRRIVCGKNIFLIPNILKRRTVGIDSSGPSDKGKDTIIVICLIPDYEGAYIYLHNHLNLPKDHIKGELHWTKLNKTLREKLMDNFEQILTICLDGLLVIKTNAFIERRGKIENLFKNLIEGCFSGYEKDPRYNTVRPSLKQKFFKSINGTETHCDPDFNPLTPDKIVRLLVQTLAKENGNRFQEYTPLFANLRSHESKPIQISDIIAGMIRTKVENTNPLDPLQVLPFDLRKMKKYRDNPPKAYYWFS